MGNVNERNALDGSDPGKFPLPLDPQGHFDPWTDKREARAIEANLYPGIETRYPPTPTPENPPQFEHEEESPNVIHQTPPMFASLGNGDDDNDLETVDETKDSKECENEETGNASLPLSDSVIPETFDTDIAEKHATNPVPTSVSVTASVLEPIQESKEEESSSFIADDNILEDVGLLSHSVPPNVDKAAIFVEGGAVPVPQLTTEEVTDSIKAPLLIEPSNVDVNPRQKIIGSSNDPKPTASFRDIFSQEQLYDCQVLSPLILGSPALPMMEECEAPVPIAFKEQHNVPVANFSVSTGPTFESENLAEDNDQNILLTKDSVNPPVHDDPIPIPYAPYMNTISLPDLDLEKDEVTNPFKSDGTVPFAEMALSLPAVMPPESTLFCSSSSSLLSSSSPLEYAQGGCTMADSSQTFANLQGIDIGLRRANNELTLIDHITFTNGLQESCHVSDGAVACVAPRVAIELQTHHPTKDQAKDLEGQILALQEGITTLAISTMGPTPTLSADDQKGCNETMQATTQYNVSMAISESSRPTPTLPGIKTHVDGTNIPTQNPNIAQELLASNLCSLIGDRSVRTVDVKGGSEHTADKPNWAKAPLEDCLPTRKTPTTRKPAGHTHDRPDWAQAPCTDVSMASENRGAQKEKERRRRVHKGKKSRKDVTIDTIPTPSPEPSPVLVMRAPCVDQTPFPVENPEPTKGIIQPLQFKPTAEHQKVAANRRKVSSWIISSVSAMDSPESDDKSVAATASNSAYMMDSVSTRGIGDDVEDHSRKEPLSPATKMANALIAQEASLAKEKQVLNKGLGANISPVQVKFVSSRDDSIGELSASDVSLKAHLNKGKKAMIRSPPAVARQRRASITSAQSGVSVRSAVSTSSRIFQLAMQDLGVCRQALSGDQDGVSLALGLQEETTLEEAVSRLNLGTNTQKSPHTVENHTPVAKTVVTFPDTPIMHERSSIVTPRSKGKVKAPVTIREKVKLDKDSRDSQDCAQFPFSFKASSPLTTDKVQAGHHSRAGLGGNPVNRLPNHMPNAKLSSAPTLKTFVPQGKYIPPPVRESQMYGQDRYGASCALSLPQSSQIPGGSTLVNAATQVPQNLGYLESRWTGTSSFVYSQPGPSAVPLGSSFLSSAPQYESSPRLNMNNTSASILQSDASTMRSNWGTQQDYRTTQAHAPSQQLEIMRDLAMTQEILQRNMEDLANLTSHGYSMLGDYQPAIFNRNNGPNIQPLQDPRGVPIHGEPRRNTQPPMLRPSSMHRIQHMNATPPHMQMQAPPQLTTQNTFTEYSRRLRHETRTALESIPSRLPRRRRT